ncbi:MAG: TatD family hydrolase [Tannerellaceae bacterium]|nr:TatD family hydrolase [Tannerellaceae bacterium]
MGIIDTHSHLYLSDFDSDRDVLIEEAKASGIEAMLLPNVDTETIAGMHALCDNYPDYAYPMMGLHPTSVGENYAVDLKKIESQLAVRPYIAIGEIGIDLYRDKSRLREQMIVFEEQLRWSLDMNLPVALHTRNAFPEVFEIIHKVDPMKLAGVFHSFGGTVADLEEIEKLPHFMIGINGVITFKNSGLADTIRHTSIDRVLLETDAPYLSPVPYRGKRNLPVYILETAKKVAEAYNLSPEEAVEITRLNALKLFSRVNNKAE